MYSIRLLVEMNNMGKIGGLSMDKNEVIKMLQNAKDLYENKQIEIALKKDNINKESYIKGVVEGLSIAIATIEQQEG